MNNTIDELNTILDDFKHKKNVLDNHTKTIVQEIKNWCIDESKRINNEFENIRLFVLNNEKFIFKKLSVDSRHYDYIKYTGFGIDICKFKDGKFYVGVNSTYSYSHNLGLWTKLPQPKGYVCIPNENGVNDYDYNNNTLDYWMDVKRSLVIRNETLNHLVNNLKRLLNSLVADEESRKNELVKNCKDVLDNELIEVKISVRIDEK